MHINFDMNVLFLLFWTFCFFCTSLPSLIQLFIYWSGLHNLIIGPTQLINTNDAVFRC